MEIFLLKETRSGENRVALTPAVVASLIKQGHTLYVQSAAGIGSYYADADYENSGATISSAIKSADVYISVNIPSPETIGQIKQGAAIFCMVYPGANPEPFRALVDRQLSVFAMESIPRISRAQNMDVLSSQANLAGYKAVILGAAELPKIFPLMMTAAGTISPAKVLIYGAGVAGLQAIATAKRLGAVVYVTDVRPETKEQVESLGGKFISVEGADEVKVEGGYAAKVSEDYLKKQKEAVLKILAQADLVITTALVMGKQAPTLITSDMVKLMKPGSVIVDMAAEQGGNCAETKRGENCTVNGVKIMGTLNLPSTLAMNASELYAKNIQNLLGLLIHEGQFKWDLNEEITHGTLIAHQGVTLNQN